MKQLSLRDAKATLSSVVDQAAGGEVVLITRYGKETAVVLGYEEYRRLSDVPSFGRLLASFPGEPEDIPDRDRAPARDFDL